MSVADWQKYGFGIYIHWPFCLSKCPYCDFNSHVSAKIDHQEWRDAYLKELETAAQIIGSRKVDSIFFGGGTPSLMEPSVVGALIEAISSYWTLSNQVEITLEANPTSVEGKKFKAFAEAGINRVSLGLQALNDHDLRALGRTHSAKEGLQALSIARSQFDRVSFDLIYARQNQTLKAWEKELNEALSFHPDHMSLYQLTIEANTRFGELYKLGKLRGLPDDALGAEFYEITQTMTEEVGLHAYEISNHAKSGQESRHNLIYWRYGDYLGIGPGAHGRLQIGGRKYATETYLNPAEWVKAVQMKGSGLSLNEELDQKGQATEYLLMALRLKEGCDLRRIETLAPNLISEENCAELLDLGFISIQNEQLFLTKKGQPVMNSVMVKLLN